MEKNIAVVLTTFNGEKYISEQIDSILGQKNVALEIIAFDDGSSDKSFSILESYKSNHDNIQAYKNEKPTGYAALNFIQALVGLRDKLSPNIKYIALSDQDDLWDDAKLENAIKSLKQNDAELYVSNLIWWEEATGIKSILKRDFVQKKYDYLFESASAGCTYVFSIALLDLLIGELKNRNFENWGFLSHDWLIYFLARKNNQKVFFDSNPYILYRIHESNVHGGLNGSSVSAIRSRLEVLKRGWFSENIKGFTQFIETGSPEMKVYNLFNKGYFGRIAVCLKYNFSLIKSKRKFIKFFSIQLISFKS
ncbi:MAG: rhamnosyltransferase [Urechidicola sp.]|jgi:rhamnosyltransferase